MIWKPSGVFSTVAFRNRATWKKRRATTGSRGGAGGGGGWGFKEGGGESRAKRRGENGQKSSTPVLWQRSISGWRTAAERAARKIGIGGRGFSFAVRFLRRKGRVTSRLNSRAARRE